MRTELGSPCLELQVLESEAELSSRLSSASREYQVKLCFKQLFQGLRVFAAPAWDWTASSTHIKLLISLLQLQLQGIQFTLQAFAGVHTQVTTRHCGVRF